MSYLAVKPRRLVSSLMTNELYVEPTSGKWVYLLSAIIYPWLDFQPSSSLSTGCGFVEGRLSHFLPRWLRTGWQSVISQGKIRRGWESNLGHSDEKQ